MLLVELNEDVEWLGVSRKVSKIILKEFLKGIL